MNLDNYAPGTQYSYLAPWNQVEDYETVKVAVTLTIIKDVEIDVPKDRLPLDNEDLRIAVREQITFPHKDSGWEETNLEVEEL